MNINLDSAKDTLCKNILIYGYCKYENKGCVFSHTTKQNTAQASGGSTQNNSNSNISTTANDSKRKFNLNTPSFQPSSVQSLSNKFANLSPKVKEIPVFIPSGRGPESAVSSASSSANEISDNNAPIKKFNAATPSFTPSNPYVTESPLALPSGTPSNANGSSQTNPYLAGATAQTPLPPTSSDVYFQQQAATYPLQYHLYAPAPPPRLTIPLPAHETNANLMFIPNDLRETLQKKNEDTLQTLPRSNLPEHVNVYHSLVPIDKIYESNSKVWGMPSSVYKVFSNVDGNPYVLRKLEHNFIITNELPFKTIKRWKSIKNANIIQLQDAFTSMAFGQMSLIVVYDYFPNSNTLAEHHKKVIASKTEPITEELLWNYIIQITNALIAIHEKGLAARSSLHLSKILVTNKNRIRLSSVGISDILNYGKDEEEIFKNNLINFNKILQREDIKKFGKIILELSVLTLPLSLRNHETKDLIKLLKTSSTISFSDEFIEVLNLLIFEENIELRTFNEKYLSDKLLKIINNLQDSTDFMESQLTTELENARLFRLITKLNFIIDRPEYTDWDENGNKYMIKLFRDHIFFQYDEFGKPIIDLSRVLVTLNKLDAGIDEKFLLVSRDEKSCIIVSYKEIRDIIDSAFRNLTRD